jgi:hypothetical protein
VTRGTTQPDGGTNVLGNLLAIHSAACALEERADTLLKAARALQRQLSRTISSRTGAMRKSSGTGRSKASAMTATSASSKRKKTPARGQGLTAGQYCDLHDCTCTHPARHQDASMYTLERR